MDPTPVSGQSARVLASFGLTMDPARRREYRERGWWPATTILDEFDAACAAHPGKIAVAGYRAGVDAPVRLTYEELAGHVARVASFLLEAGVGPGDVVSAQLPNWWEYPAVALATLRVGAALNPVLPIHRVREVSFIAGMLAPKVYFAPASFRAFDYPGMLAEIWAGLPAPPLTVLVGADGGPSPASFGPDGNTAPASSLPSVALPSALSFERDVLGMPVSPDAGAGSHRARGVDPDLVSDIQFTSGTTGEPKGVGHVHATLVARTRALASALDIDGTDVVHMPSPITHSTGLVYGVMTPLSRGMTTVLQDVWEPRCGLEIIAAERASWTFATTTFIVDLIRAQRRDGADVRSMRYLVSGGAAIPPALVAEAADVLGARVMAVWGMTENGAVTCTRDGAPADAAATSDGPPCPWMALRVVDPAGADVPVGEVGQLVVRGASQMLGYVHRPALTAGAFDDRGWFRTGDLARLLPDGSVRITGRLKDIIIRGGENIPVTEIETILYTHPAVADVAIVPYPDPRFGERACAVVVPRPGTPPTLADLTAHLDAHRVAKTYWPERIELVEQMPKTASGKIQKFVLRELVERAAVSAR